MVYVDTNSSPSPLEKGLRKKRFFFYLMHRVFFSFAVNMRVLGRVFFMSDVCVCGILMSLHNNDGDGYDDAEGS